MWRGSTCVARWADATVGRRAVRFLAAEADGRRRRRNARPKTLSALLAEGQVRRVLTSARGARHDVVLPTEITFPVGDNTGDRPSSGLRPSFSVRGLMSAPHEPSFREPWIHGQKASKV
jgi:hypothetical protein